MQHPPTLSAIRVFYSYSHKDEKLREQLETHLSLLRREGFISEWHDRKILPGAQWAGEIDEHLARASLILLLISPDFMASDYCYDKEMARALERHKRGEARVIPIILRACDWKTSPFARLQSLPRDGKAVTTWENKDEAFTNVATGIRRAIEALLSDSTTSTSHTTFPAIWNVPYARNPFFTERDEILSCISARFQKGQANGLSQPQALSGLGGIGKTQIALEYAYRYRQEYQAVFWTRADTHEALVSGYMEIARLLHLPQKVNERERMSEKVLQWLEDHAHWLLILDNVDDLTVVREFLPQRFGGHLLLTTRASSTRALAYRVEVEAMSQEVGAQFLLRRAGLIEQDASLETALSHQDIALAKTITQELGGLPLALDQAGAYIDETQCSLPAYRDLYCKRKAEILSRRGGLVGNYLESVTTTWSLAFQKVEQQNGAASALLRFCACLAPAAIPEEIVTKGAPHLGKILAPVAADPLRLDRAIESICAYSLIRRERETHMLTIHPLVQTALRQAMPLRQTRIWMQRALLAVSAAFPTEQPGDTSLCERCLPHALHCASWVTEKDFNVRENTRLLDQIGTYLVERKHVEEEAEPWHPRVVTMSEQQASLTDPNIVVSLNNLALMYNQQGKLTRAVSLYWRALIICEQRLNATDPLTVITLNNIVYLSNQHWGLNMLWWAQEGADKEIVALQQRAGTLAEALAKAIYKQLESSTDPIAIDRLSFLAYFFLQQDLPYHADLLYRRLLSIYEQQLDSIEPMQMIVCLNGLGLACAQLEVFLEAEEWYKRALSLCEKHLSPTHRKIFFVMRNLMDTYFYQYKYVEAEELYQRILTRLRQIPERNSPDLKSVEKHCTGFHVEMQELLVEAEYFLHMKQKEYEEFFKTRKETVKAHRSEFLKRWSSR